MNPTDTAAPRPVSIFRRRWRKFRALKRGWYSFLLLAGAYFLSFFLFLLVSDRAIAVHYEGQTYFPAFAATFEGRIYQARDFGQRAIGETNYRTLAKTFASDSASENWILLPPYPYSPTESLLRELPGNPPHGPSLEHWCGTDDRGRDVFARLAYGFRISISFALGVVALSYAFGAMIGAILGYFGGRIDFLGGRVVEIWAALPFLYTIIIISSIVQPTMTMLVVLLAAFGWIGISFYIRGEFYREKTRDYVAAAIAQGESNASVIFRHILPNSLTPVISFAPFAIVGSIGSLVSLDFLGFGLPPPTPSWGELVSQGLANIRKWHLVLFPLGALFGTLLMVVFVGEAIREAFDPKVQARLR